MTFRTINVSDLMPVDPELDAQAYPNLQWIAISDLVIDDRYQRPLARANWLAIQKIAKNFNWNRFAPVLVAPVAGGKFAVVDGQHRSHAAALCGIESVPAMSVAMSPAQQASAFSWVNGSVTAITAFHIYRAALAAGEVWALDCKAAVEAADCRLMTSQQSAAAKKPKDLYCIGLIRKDVAAGHADVVTRVLSALVASAGDADHKDRYAARVLQPLLEVLVAHPGLMSCDLVSFLKAQDVLGVVDRIPVIRKRDEYRDKGNAEIARILVLALMRRYFGMPA